MLQYLRRYGLAILVAIALLFPFVFYSSDLTSHREFSIAEKIVFSVSKPIEYVFHWTISGSSKFYNKYVDLRAAKDAVAMVAEENAKLKIQIQAIKEIAVENARLRQLLSLVERSELKFRSCEIVSFDPSFLFRNVRIGCGDREGIVAGMGVLSADGVVGIVMRTGMMFSDVLLITDPNSNLDVIVARNRRRGILAGNSAENMQFKYSDRGTRIQVGDDVVSSGFTGPFPAGLVVGSVSRISGETDGVEQIIEIEPSVKVHQLAEVLVLLQPSREIDIIRRHGGDDWMRRIVDGSSSQRIGGQ